MALGRPEDTSSLPAFCNRFLAMAGIGHRVREVDPTDPGTADDAEFGSMVNYVRASYPSPSHDCSRTTAELGPEPTPLDEGLGLTLDWLRGHTKLP